VEQHATPGDRQATLSKEDAQTYALIHHAITKREQVLGFYLGQWVTVCPHTLGWRDGELHLWCYELFAAPGGQIVREPLRSPRLWRLFRLADFRAVTTRLGFWLTPPTSRRPALDIAIAVESRSHPRPAIREDDGAQAGEPAPAPLRLIRG